MEKNAFNVFPNPIAGNILNIEMPNVSNYTIYNIEGKQFMKGRLEKGINTIEVSALQKGIYLIKTELGSQKIIIQ